MAPMAGNASSEKCWWRDCCKAAPCWSASRSYAGARCVLTLLKSWFIYECFVISFRLPTWNWIPWNAVCFTKRNLSWTCSQWRRGNGSCVRLAALSLMAGSSFASVLILQNRGRIWMKRCNAFTHQQDTIWVFFCLKGSCDRFCFSLGLSTL